MNWGKGLTLFIVGFILAMLGMVYISFKQSNEMIEDNYYDREVKYQEVIDAKNRLTPYMSDLILRDSSNFILLELPKNISANISNGQIRLIKLDQASSDRTIEVSNTISKLNKENLKKGTYRVKLNWENNNVSYFYENDLMVN